MVTTERPPVTAEPPPRPHRDTERIVIYSLIVVVLLALVGMGIARYHYAKATSPSEAVTKADQVIAKWQAAGLRVPTRDVVVRLYGTDGGLLCQIQPTGTVKGQYLEQLANGAGGPGQRGGVVLQKVVAGERAMLEVYCPERVAAFDDIVAGLKTTSP